MPTALNIQPRLIHNELYSAFGDQQPSYNTVAKWSRWFRKDIQDHARLVTETTIEHIEEVRCFIHPTIDEMQVETGISHVTIEWIISEHLQLKKITAHWVS